MSLQVHRLNVVFRHKPIHPEQETVAAPGFRIIQSVCLHVAVRLDYCPWPGTRAQKCY